MRNSIRLALLILSTTAATAAFADELPPHKSGEWEVAIVAGKRAPAKMKMCVDKKTEDLFYKTGLDVGAQVCDHHEVKVKDNVATVEAHCKVAGSMVTTTSVARFDGDAAFHAESTSRFEPALMGRKEAATTQDGKWIGACPAGMKPGDFAMDNGIKVNTKMLGALKKFLQ